MRKKKSAKKKPGKRKPSRLKRSIRAKEPIQRKRPTRFMEPTENMSAQIHQGVEPEPQPGPARRFPEDDAEYGGES